MGRRGWAIVVATLLVGSPALWAEHEGPEADQEQPAAAPDGRIPIAVRPGTLGDLIDTLAGNPVRLPYSRVVGVFDPKAFLIETQTALRPIVGHRSRVVVLIENGELRVDPALLVASTVTVSGHARTLLGMQVSREVPWPAALTRRAVERLEIRAAVLAEAVTTPEGVDLLAR